MEFPPGTDIVRRLNENILPTTQVDKAAMKHDITYYNVRDGLRSRTLTVPEAKKKIRESDNILIKEAKKNVISPLNPANSSHAVGAIVGMKAKTLAEDSGLIDELKFVGTGKMKKIKGMPADPLRKLRKAMLKGVVIDQN